jgi:hypothetical protein
MLMCCLQCQVQFEEEHSYNVLDVGSSKGSTNSCCAAIGQSERGFCHGGEINLLYAICEVIIGTHLSGDVIEHLRRNIGLQIAPLQ